MCSGYHHVIIAEESQTLLAFSWVYSDGTVVTYVFVAMPFGWAPACYVFFLYFKPFVSRWRSMGMTASIWIDDGIIAAQRSIGAVRAQEQNNGIIIHSDVMRQQRVSI